MDAMNLLAVFCLLCASVVLAAVRHSNTSTRAILWAAAVGIAFTFGWFWE